eukprot:3701922-Pyramimonas_sp.AAC.1
MFSWPHLGWGHVFLEWPALLTRLPASESLARVQGVTDQAHGLTVQSPPTQLTTDEPEDRPCPRPYGGWFADAHCLV